MEVKLRILRQVEVKVKAKAKAKILFNEGVSKILGGMPPPKFWTLPHLALTLTLTETLTETDKGVYVGLFNLFLIAK